MKLVNNIKQTMNCLNQVLRSHCVICMTFIKSRERKHFSSRILFYFLQSFVSFVAMNPFVYFAFFVGMR